MIYSNGFNLGVAGIKNATSNDESSALLIDKITSTPRQCSQIVTFIESNHPAIKYRFTHTVTR